MRIQRMALNKLFKIFHETDVLRKLKILEPIGKRALTRSDLLQNTTLNTSKLTPLLEELLEKEYINVDVDGKYHLTQPLPKESEIKIFKYILTKSPKHSTMLRSTKVEAKRLKVILNKLYEDGLLDYDFKRERYSIASSDDDIIQKIIESISTPDKIRAFILSYRKSRERSEGISPLLDTFFSFQRMQSLSLDMASFFLNRGFTFMNDLNWSYEEDENDENINNLTEEILTVADDSPVSFWNNMRADLSVSGMRSHEIIISEINELDEVVMQKAIRNIPYANNMEKFVKALEYELFGDYSDRLLNTDYRNFSTDVGKALYPYYIKKYPIETFEKAFRDSINLFFSRSEYTYSMSFGESGSSVKFDYIARKGSKEFLSNLNSSLATIELYANDQQRLLDQLVDMQYIFPESKITPRMKAILYFCVKDEPKNEWVLALRKIFPNAWQELIEDKEWDQTKYRKANPTPIQQ